MRVGLWMKAAALWVGAVAVAQAPERTCAEQPESAALRGALRWGAGVGEASLEAIASSVAVIKVKSLNRRKQNTGVVRNPVEASMPGLPADERRS